MMQPKTWKGGDGACRHIIVLTCPATGKYCKLPVNIFVILMSSVSLHKMLNNEYLQEEERQRRGMSTRNLGNG